MGNISTLPEETKDAVVRDYLRGDKGIVIEYEHKLSPGTMYRILHEREVPLRSKGEWVPAPEPIPDADPPVGSGFLAAIKAMVDQDVTTENVLGAIYDALAEWFPKEDFATLRAIGLWEKATGEGVTADEIVKAAMETLVCECMRAVPDAEEIEPGVFRWRGGN